MREQRYFIHVELHTYLLRFKYTVLCIRLHVQFGQSAKHENHDSGLSAQLCSATKVSRKHFLRSCHSMGTTRLLKRKNEKRDKENANILYSFVTDTVN